MAKAKSSGGNSKKNTPVPKESFGLPGKTYKVPANAVKTTSFIKPKTPVKGATQGFAGSGTPLGSSMGINPVNKKQITNAASMLFVASSTKGVIGAIAKRAGKKSFVATSEAAYTAGSKGLGASGMGGKIKVAGTLSGKQISSTAVGTAAQQAARMGNLEVNAFRNAVRAGQIAQTKKIVNVVKGLGKADKIAKDTVVAGFVLKNKFNSKKKNK